MKLIINIEMGNAAFGEDANDRGQEANRILRSLGGKISEGIEKGDCGTLRDYNGNKVGTWKVTKR